VKTRILAEKHVPLPLCQPQIPFSTGFGSKLELCVVRILVQIYYFSSSGQVKCIGCITQVSNFIFIHCLHEVKDKKGCYDLQGAIQSTVRLSVFLFVYLISAISKGNVVYFSIEKSTEKLVRHV
jgi:hypothetical protein